MNGAGEGSNKMILVVDDTEPIRKMVSAMLKLAGYRCLEAADGDEGFRIFESATAEVDLILTDVVMPKMDGAELARRASRVRPDVRVVFMSGFSDHPVVQGIEESKSLFLPKPFTAGALVEKIRQALDSPAEGLADPKPVGSR
jgi:DNA-binding response OmpR family regulator